MSIAGIYCWVCADNGGRRYVGQSIDLEHRRMGHIYDLRYQRHCNPHLQAAYNKYGEHAFEYRIIEPHVPIDRLDEREIFWIKYYKSLSHENGYNLEGGGFSGKVRSPESIEKGAAKLRGRPRSEETKARIARANKGYGLGRKLSPEICKKIGDAARGRTMTPENKARMSALHTGKKASPETLLKMSLGRKGIRKGIPHTAEHKAKISASHMGIGLGSKHTEETKAKMRADPMRHRPKSKEWVEHFTGLAKARWLDPEYKAKMVNMLRGRTFSDETRAKMKASRKAYFARLAQEKLVGQQMLFQEVG